MGQNIRYELALWFHRQLQIANQLADTNDLHPDTPADSLVSANTHISSSYRYVTYVYHLCATGRKSDSPPPRKSSMIG